MHGSAEALHRRTWTIRGQFQQGRGSSQLLLPIGQLALQHFSLQPLPLPEGKVGILQGQLGQRAGLPSAIGRVEGRQFPQEDLYRPVIGDDMVHGEQQHMLLGSQAQDLCAHQGSLRQGKGALRLLGRQAPGLRLALFLG